MTTLRETIRSITAAHLDAGHLVIGQCLSAVGFVGNTLPEHGDMTELPMSDVAQSGFVVGAALTGRRPIYVVRYQGFMLLNAALLLSYAAKARALWGRKCPVLIRAIAMEGGIGPVNGSTQHSLFTRLPGDVRVIAPMTPGEWRGAYDSWMEREDVVYLSEHRGAWDNALELPDYFWNGSQNLPHPEVILFPTSITRFAALEVAKHNPAVRVHHIKQLRPFLASSTAYYDLSMSRKGGLVLDDDFPGGAGSAIAHRLAAETGARVEFMGLEDRVAGFGPGMDNLPPTSEQIKQRVREMLK